MRNMFTYDFTNRTIVATKATLKKASNPTTDEYTALIKMIEGQPTFRVVEKTIKNSGNKKTYKGLTLKMMMDYISNQKNSEELMAEFNEAQGDAKNKYPSAKQALHITPDEMLTKSDSELTAQQEEILSRLNACSPKDRETALRLLSVYLQSLSK